MNEELSHNGNSLLEPPVPRKMASRPVAWIAATMADGAANVDQYLALMQNGRSPKNEIHACGTNGGAEGKGKEKTMGRTCAFDGHELVFKIRFDFLDPA